MPVIENWELSHEKEVFHAGNLYERINGAAPLFFENHFREMTSIEYTQGDNSLTIQVYRHETPQDAFGMYASERSSEMTFYSGIGGEAQGDRYGLFFFAGSLYVKMTTSDETDEMQQALLNIATQFSQKIDPSAAYPALFSVFPKEGLIAHSQSYITKNYIGHEFLPPAYTADYEQDGRKFQVFVMNVNTNEEAQKIIQRYFRFTKQNETFSEGRILLKDRYNGDIPLLWKGKYLIGAYNENGESFPETIYDFLENIKI